MTEPRASDAWRTPARQVGRATSRVLLRFPRQFGLFELMALGSVEWMRRHLAILNELERVRLRYRMNSMTVLDFGGAEGALGRAIDLYGLNDRFAVSVVDVDREAISRTAIRSPIIAATAIDPDDPLPFTDRAFDVVVSSDVFEHIPKIARTGCAAEVSRVKRLAEIHTMPLDSSDGIWQSTVTDTAFAAWQQTCGTEPDRWTAEHLEIGAPTIDEVMRLFPGARIEPIANARVWMESMQAQRGPKDPAARVRYALRQLARRGDWRRPPYKNALVVRERDVN